MQPAAAPLTQLELLGVGGQQVDDAGGLPGAQTLPLRLLQLPQEQGRLVQLLLEELGVWKRTDGKKADTRTRARTHAHTHT